MVFTASGYFRSLSLVMQLMIATKIAGSFISYKWRIYDLADVSWAIKTTHVCR